MIERYSRSLLTLLSNFVNENHTHWDDQLPYVMAAYRGKEHKSTTCTPNLLMLNMETTCPLDLIVGHPSAQEPQEWPVAYVEWVKQSMIGAHEVVYDALGRAATRQSGLQPLLKVPKVQERELGLEIFSTQSKPEAWSGLGWTIFGAGVFDPMDLQDSERTKQKSGEHLCRSIETYGGTRPPR